ncbi:hypothetical protein KIH86_25885 [Paenibacillus sp. HN-1]|uniref:hypothetical protein n=1 Tax=Paenibacillus TaxID=44249 RepID=UPI001CA94CDE|nr:MULTISPECIES: hypothetical protein [Paenibacillus]MBY9078909.1 hypothetical protein [Paenibacillus sp. CGMCC 1.18879]MBY9087622.1 hypothetical protein [Paenibacillus sinensis]
MGRRDGQMSWKVLFDEKFMRKHTAYNSLDEFLASGGFGIGELEEIVRLDKERLDCFIAQGAGFEKWEDMLSEALGDYFEKTFGFYDI